MNQSGYSLLISLFVLVGITGSFIAGNGIHKNYLNRNQTLELDLARQALISYAVNYIDHYGVRGAGAGHLPCPDTDTPDQTHSDPWYRDGPNPPCAKEHIEVGWLPRHVNTSAGRYHFHTRTRQRLWYAVSAQFVNNPVNRIVNPASSGIISIGSFDDIVAVLSVPAQDSRNAQPQAWWDSGNAGAQPSAYAIIRTDDIRGPAMQRVAAWLLRRLNYALVDRSTTMTGQTCGLSGELELLSWLSVKTQMLDCENYYSDLLAEFSVFEQVPYKKHWFIRNKWYDYFIFSVEQSCFDVSPTVCKFVLDSINMAEQKIALKLQPVLARNKP